LYIFMNGLNDIWSGTGRRRPALGDSFWPEKVT
jgi:hypothetical protein